MENPIYEISSRNIDIWFLFTILNGYIDFYYRKQSVKYSTEIVIFNTYEDRIWYVNGKEHRENDKPAIEYSNGTKEWYVNGKRHRSNDSPAVIWNTGSRFWYKNGNYHRDNDNPAIIFSNRDKNWYIDGKYIKSSY